jgi:hypothetical protein
MTERNNLDRMAVPSHDPAQNNKFDQINTPAPEQQPSALKFSVPTEFVELPTRGKYYPSGHPLRGKESVEIKFMTAKEEDILASQTLIKRGVVFDRLLQSVMVDQINPDDLLVADKNAILIATRITGYGHEYETEVRCPSCSNRAKFTFDLAENSAVAGEDKEAMQQLAVRETESGTFVFDLPKINSTVEVKLLTGHDEKRLSFITKSKNKNNIIESFITDTLKSYIVSVNGDSKRETVNAFVDTLPARQSRTIRNVYKSVVPRVTIESPYSCNSCGHEQELEVPLNADFFWPNE